MKTTLDLDDDQLQLRLRAEAPPARQTVSPPVFDGRGGLVPGVDPSSNKAMLKALDRDDGGNDLPGAGLAAAMQQFGEHLVSFDRDFKKLLGRSHFTLLDPTPR